MNWNKSEKQIYDEALALVEKTNQQIARVYLSVQKEISDKLKKFYLSVDPSWSKQYQAQRLTEIFKEINKRLTVMTGLTTDIIEKAYLNEYLNTFKSYEYSLNEYFQSLSVKSRNDIVKGATNTTTLPFNVSTEKEIMAGLNAKIGEYSFQKALPKRRPIMIDALREEVTKSIALGESPAKLAKRIENTFFQEISFPIRTARTELLKAYSIAQDESISQAVDMGIEFNYIWRTRIDGRERTSHHDMNGKKAKVIKGFPVFTVGLSKGSAPRLLVGYDQARQCINCRCRRLNVPSI